MTRLLYGRHRAPAEATALDGSLLLDAAGPGSHRSTRPRPGDRRASGHHTGGHRLPGRGRPRLARPAAELPGHLDIALHIEPVPNPVAAAGLKKQRARLESGRRTGFDKGHLDDPEVEAAAADAADLAYRIARGEGKLFHVALYLTVHAPDEETLAEQTAAVRAVAESLLMTIAPTTYRALPGWLSTLPSASTHSRSASRWSSSGVQ
ncbi:hypothetical protein ACRAWF_38095 [Streptomyces sp. L7]